MKRRDKLKLKNSRERISQILREMQEDEAIFRPCRLCLTALTFDDEC